jgi:hypothetical protein
MSSDKQDKSPDQQRAEIAKLAKRYNCHVVAEFYDEAVSGWKTAKRKSFQEMLRFVVKPDAPKIILAWDMDRFSRLDSIDSGEIIAPLRRAGVQLITSAQGPIDWNSFTGRLMFNIQQEGKNQFVVELARNITRARVRLAQSREMNPTAIPYGMDKLIFDEAGTLQRRVRFGETFHRPRTWRGQFAPAEDIGAVAVVRWIFETFASRDVSVLWLVNDLNRRGVPSPRGGHWSRAVVRRTLENPAYAGHTASNRTTAGKFYGVKDGEVCPADEVRRAAKGEAIRRPMSPDQWLIAHDTHEPIVPPTLWNKVQVKLGRISAARQNGQRPRTNDFVLTGLLRCGHCDGKMRGNASTVKRSRGRVDTVRRYYCQTPALKGKAVCRCRSIAEQPLMEFLLSKVQELVVSDELVERIRAAALRQLADHTQAPAAEEKRLQKQLADLNAKIDRATENLLLADPAHLAAAQKKLAEWQAQRADVASKLAEAGASSPADANPAVLAEEVIRELHRVREGISDDDPAIVRQALATVVERIDLWFEGRQCGKKHISRFSRGLLTLKPVFSASVVAGTLMGPSSSLPTFSTPTPTSRCS